MKKLLLIIMMAAFAGCAAKQSVADCASEQTVAPDSTQSFATTLFEAVNKLTPEENFCISPSSAHWALSMTANGACGSTADEIYSTLNNSISEKERAAFNCSQQKNIEQLQAGDDSCTKIANSIWINTDIKIKEPFIESNKKYYYAEVKNSSFDAAATDEINSWCSEKTNGKIKSIINKPDPSTQMLLVNALYFKAQWTHPFNEKLTKKALFTAALGKKVEVDMMQQSRFFPYHEDDVIQAVKKTFAHGEYVMLLVLPRPGATMNDAIKHLQKIYCKNFAQDGRCQVQLSMPKFKIEFGTSLKQPLQEMGVRTAFTTAADFSGISKTSLLINDILQKTFIAVDEKGAEAAAVTAVQMRTGMLPPQEKKILTLDRPFIYAITNNRTGEILFIGKVGNPNK